MDQNPYTAPRDLTASPPLNEDEAARFEFLRYEGFVRGIASLYLVAGIILLFSAIGLVIMAWDATYPQGMWLIAAVLGVAGLLVLGTAFRLRDLDTAGRLAAMVISTIAALLSFGAWPLGLIGAIFHGFILLVLFLPKSSFVCSSRYREIVAATPHIKCRTPLVVWILLGILVLAFLAIVAFGVPPF